jgi:hypothetical protein
VSVPATRVETSQAETRAIALEAYVYLYPLVLMEVTRRQVTSLPAGQRPGFGPAGAFAHMRAFPAADFKAVVRPNFDTLYSSAWLDLADEPVVVSAPDTDGRYYLLPMLDMWTDVFAAPGTRTSGTQAGDFVVAGPGWHGEPPEGMSLIQAPTSCVWVIGRFQTNGPADYEAVHEVQDGLRITPLSRWPQAPEPVAAWPDPSVDAKTPPADQVAALSGREFFTLAQALLDRYHGHLTDWSVLERLRRLDLDRGYDALDPSVQAAVDAAPAAALELMREGLIRVSRIVDGWLVNNDSMGVYGNFYLKRAIVALVGLGVNPPEDAVYPVAVADADGQPLTGDRDYVLHFERDELPPAQAFWSVTMYDEEGFQVANVLDRFALGDRDDLIYNADGSLDLYLRHTSPGADREANWLPAPRGPLGITLRLYAPAPEVLDGRWTPPAIRRVAEG